MRFLETPWEVLAPAARYFTCTLPFMTLKWHSQGNTVRYSSLLFFFFVDWVVCNVLRTETSSLALYTLVQEIVLLCMFHLETEPEMIFQTFWSQDLRHVSSSVLQIKSSSTRSQVLLKQGFQKKEKRLPPSTVSEIMSVHTNTRENTNYMTVHVHWACTYRC